MSIVFQPHFTALFQEWNPIVFSNNSNFENSKITSYYCDANAPQLFNYTINIFSTPDFNVVLSSTFLVE